MTWFARLAIAAGLCVSGEAVGEESAGPIRARVLATRLETEVAVELRNGQKWSGTLSDVSENHFLLLAEPDKETRKRLRLGSGMKLKKNLPFEDVVALDGAVSADVVEKYLVLGADHTAAMQVRLAAAALGGFRVRASAGSSMVLLEKVESSAPFEYVVLTVSEKGEKELDDWGAKGFHAVPNTVGSWLGKPSVVLERTPEDTAPRDYRVLAASREGTLEKELLDAVAQGYRVTGLTKPGERVALLESRAASSSRAEHRLLSDVDSALLRREAEDGYQLVSCSDGERLCVLEKMESGNEPYSFLAARQLSTLEKELNDLGSRGHQFLPPAFGRDSETFAVLKDTRSSSAFEYRGISRNRADELQSDIAGLVREGFAVAAMTSDTTSAYAGGGALGAAASEAMAKAIVVMERLTSK
jgi:small nuclear ribonucleoprotein (snRNP)-like protein